MKYNRDSAFTYLENMDEEIIYLIEDINTSSFQEIKNENIFLELIDTKLNSYLSTISGKFFRYFSIQNYDIKELTKRKYNNLLYRYIPYIFKLIDDMYNYYKDIFNPSDIELILPKSYCPFDAIESLTTSLINLLLKLLNKNKNLTLLKLNTNIKFKTYYVNQIKKSCKDNKQYYKTYKSIYNEQLNDLSTTGLTKIPILPPY